MLSKMYQLIICNYQKNVSLYYFYMSFHFEIVFFIYRWHPSGTQLAVASKDQVSVCYMGNGKKLSLDSEESFR